MKNLRLFEEFDAEFGEVVYHGTPHKFEGGFSLSMFGEGEGASGFGYGLYFTDDLDDAIEYARKLERKKGKGRVYKCIIPNREYFYNLDLPMSDQSDFIQEAFMEMSKKSKLKIFWSEYEDYEAEYKDGIETGEYDFTTEELELHLSVLLDDLIKGIGVGLLELLKQNLGSDYSQDDEVRASKFLERMGIKGTMHNGFGHTHYIVFDDEDIKVLYYDKRKRFSDLN